MKFLGILLVIASIAVFASGLILPGLIVLAIALICLSSSSKSKEDEQKQQQEVKETKSKEDWILDRTAEYIQQGMSPSDSKVKAGVDYKKYLDDKIIREEEENPRYMYFCNKCLSVYSFGDSIGDVRCEDCGKWLYATKMPHSDWIQLSSENKAKQKGLWAEQCK